MKKGFKDLRPARLKDKVRSNGLRLVSAWVMILLALYLLMPATPTEAAINQIMVTNVTDVSFNVNWTTTTAVSGSTVNWGLSSGSLTNSAADSISGSSTTHSVFVNHGSPSTTIYFEVVSGGTVGGQQVTSGAALGVPPSGQNITGTVYKTGGVTPAPNVIVFIQLQDAGGGGSGGSSQWGSTITDSSGTWIYNLGGLRTSNASAYFSWTAGTDKVRLLWQGGADGCIGESPSDERIYTTPSTFPGTFNMTLDGNPTAVRLSALKATPLSRPPGLPVLLLAAGLLAGGVWLLRRKI
jgi:hypothetical protein